MDPPITVPRIADFRKVRSCYLIPQQVLIPTSTDIFHVLVKNHQSATSLFNFKTSRIPSIKRITSPLPTSQQEPTMAALIRNKLANIPYPTQTFDGQTIIVTGANTGLGLEAARHFTRLNAAKVILGCRSIAKGEEAALSIAQTTGRKVWQVDLGDFNSVKQFTERASKLERLDVVVENAGIAALAYREVEGMEATIAINVVGTFLMALNFLSILRESGKKTGTVPRLVIVSSNAHLSVREHISFVRIDLESMDVRCCEEVLI